MSKIEAWHFLGGTDAPALRNGAPLVVGEWLHHEGPVKFCESGLHASRRAYDALQYAPGSWVARVECKGIETEQGYKLVCRSRKALWCYDAIHELRAFARRCALDALPSWPDAPASVRQYLETGDESIRDATWYPSWAASWYAAWAAFCAAARDAKVGQYAKWLEQALRQGARDRGLT